VKKPCNYQAWVAVKDVPEDTEAFWEGAKIVWIFMWTAYLNWLQ